MIEPEYNCSDIELDNIWSLNLYIHFIINKEIITVVKLNYPPTYTFKNLTKYIPYMLKTEFNYTGLNNYIIEYRTRDSSLIKTSYKCNCNNPKCNSNIKYKNIKLHTTYSVVQDWSDFLLPNDTHCYIYPKNLKKYGIFNENKDLLGVFYNYSDMLEYISKQNRNNVFLIYLIGEINNIIKLIDVINLETKMYNSCVNRMVRTYM